MSEDRPYQDPEGSLHERLRKEKVQLDGGTVWVWELNTAEMLSIRQRSMRPAVGGGGIDDAAATAWLAAMCTRRSDEPNSPRIWDDMNHTKVLYLRAEESTRLIAACKRVNGLDPEEQQAAEDFSTATGAPNSSGFTSSPSNNSTGSPPSSDTSPTAK